MMSGTVVQTLILTIITVRYDWESEVSIPIPFWFVWLVITELKNSHLVTSSFRRYGKPRFLLRRTQRIG